MARPLLPTYVPFPFPLVRGEGDRVFDNTGRDYFDFYGGNGDAYTETYSDTKAAPSTTAAPDSAAVKEMVRSDR